jgi:hypothetical protein
MDMDPHQDFDLDPDPHQNNADPQCGSAAVVWQIPIQKICIIYKNITFPICYQPVLTDST